ncbi:MAG: hypothetical protein MJ082_04770, partial [Clostridia bacterium]|nr:hypothetical protein [Clostridia bacterium]
MKKTVLFALFLILAVAVLGLTSCGCEHEWKETSVAKEATCHETGERVLTCSKCGETKKETIPKTDHEYDAGVDVVKNGCETEGQKLFTCKICNTTKTEITPAKGGHLWNGGRITVDPTCTMKGTREFVCNRCGGTRTEPVAATGKHTYSENYIIVKAPTATSAGEARAYCETCVSSYLTKSVTLAEYNTMKTEAINASNAVAASSFGGTTYTKMSTTAYAAPVTSPKAGQHPRLLFTGDDLPAIREAMANDVDANELKGVINAALEYDSAILGATSKKDSSDRYGPKGTHNCNEAKLRCIIAKAFLYQVYGTDLYGYQAIRMMKEYLTTLKIESVNDSCRYYGYTMFVSAIVYDWCYDLLTKTEKTEIICGIQYKLAPGMEVGFPPSGQGALAGHGSERQILRDYLSVALAIYDEEPTWYAFIGGRFYADYVPVRNTYYLSDFTPQGISTYVQIRFTSDLWSAWLMKSATGANPYINNMGNVMESYLCHIVNGDTEIFESGDDELKDATERLKSMDLAFAISGYLYDDDTMWT